MAPTQKPEEPKFITTRLSVSRFEAWIFSDYHEARWKLAGDPTGSLDLQEAQRWMGKSEDLALEIAKNNSRILNVRLPLREPAGRP